MLFSPFFTSITDAVSIFCLYRDLQVISSNAQQTGHSYLNAFLDWERINSATGGQPRRHIPTIGGISDIDRINSYLRSR